MGIVINRSAHEGQNPPVSKKYLARSVYVHYIRRIASDRRRRVVAGDARHPSSGTFGEASFPHPFCPVKVKFPSLDSSTCLYEQHVFVATRTGWGVHSDPYGHLHKPGGIISLPPGNHTATVLLGVAF